MKISIENIIEITEYLTEMEIFTLQVDNCPDFPQSLSVHKSVIQDRVDKIRTLLKGLDDGQ